MIEVKNLFAGYNGADVICNINIKAGRGESLCILGPNSSGKSTLLKSIARIINYRGQVLLEGRDAASFSRREFAKRVALLSQSMQVFFPFTVYETVSMGRFAYSRGFMKSLTADDKAIVEDVLRKLDIWDIRKQMIDELSGGTIQRVFLARTLAQTPQIILLDEPANHLDLKHQIELLDYLKAWVKESGKTLIGVFHDFNLARRFGDTAVVMRGGTTAAAGRIEDVLNSAAFNTVFGIDVSSYMRESLEKWK